MQKGLKALSCLYSVILTEYPVSAGNMSGQLYMHFIKNILLNQAQN
jgi:hypothetical protein